MLVPRLLWCNISVYIKKLISLYALRHWPFLGRKTSFPVKIPLINPFVDLSLVKSSTHRPSFDAAAHAPPPALAVGQPPIHRPKHSRPKAPQAPRVGSWSWGRRHRNLWEIFLVLATQPKEWKKWSFLVKTPRNTMVGICGGEVLVATFRAEICPERASQHSSSYSFHGDRFCSSGYC